MDTSSKSFNIDVVLSVLRRRLWLAISLFGVVLNASVTLVVSLPNLYRASTFILVEGQQIPPKYVQATVTSGIQSRLHTISQEILSRSRLQRLIKKFRLYEDLRKRLPSDEVIAAMRRDIGIKIKGVGGRGNRHTVAFEASYTGADPRKVLLVATTLASFYIEENLKIRERQALGTTDFLRGELEQVKKRLEEQEQRLANYKRKHLGELPGQLQANLKTLDRFQAQMKLVSDNLTRAQERRDAMIHRIEEINGGPSSSFEETRKPGGLARQIEMLVLKLTVLKTRFSDNYPDVIRLKREISVLQEELIRRIEAADSQANGSSPHARLQAKLSEIDAMIKLRTAKLEKTGQEIARYQTRIENTPKRVQELLLVTRDYSSTRQLYNSLLKRQEEASLASSMEQHQKAERFHIIDAAIRPEMPISPNRLRLFLLGLFLSFGVSGAGVLLREMTDTSFHRVEHLQGFTKAPILVAIPSIVTKGDRLRWRLSQGLAVVALSLLLLAVVWGSYLISTGNEELVKRFSKSPRGLQLRK